MRRNISGVTTSPHRYVDTVKDLQFWDHPNSPEGRRSNTYFIADEFKDDREHITGVYRPPICTFKVGRLNFHIHNSWQEALAATLAASGCRALDAKTKQPVAVTAEAVQYSHQRLEQKATTDPNFELVHKLYHPADHNRAVFANEPECARLARYYRRDLAILAPHTPADGLGYNRFWQPTNRPPMRWYWSTGQQGLRTLVTLACFPVYGKGKTREAHWLTVTPAIDQKVAWDSYFSM